MTRRILLIDSTPGNRISGRAMLCAVRYEVDTAATGAEGLACIARAVPDVILADHDMTDIPLEIFCRKLRMRLGDGAPPVIALAPRASPELRLSLLQAGAFTVLQRPLDRVGLLTHLRSLLRAKETRAELRRRNATAATLGFAEDARGFGRRARIALVGTTLTQAGRLSRALREVTSDRIEPMTHEDALVAAEGRPDSVPEVFVLCRSDDPEAELSLLCELRARPASRRAGIILEHAEDDPVVGARAMDLGVNDLVHTDATRDEVALRIARQLQMKRESDTLRASLDAGLALAAHDPLTGLFNRRYALRYLKDLARGTHVSGHGYGLLMLDVDHFKSVNDTYGHAGGDAVLEQVAQRLSDHVREGDLLARVGGEEFLVALPNTTLEEALIAAERLRTAIGNGPIVIDAVTEVSVTVSVGVACGTGEPTAQLASADAALYLAKGDGRNRVRAATCLHKGDMAGPETRYRTGLSGAP